MNADLSGIPCWVVIPAAGSGRRIGGDLPKQYLPLAGRPVIEHVLGRFSAHPAVRGIVVAVADDDERAARLIHDGPPPVVTVLGGAERRDSVLNGLHRLMNMAQHDDWVLVHDAARPCLRSSDIDLLIGTLRDHPVGGLLGVRIADTLKRVDSLDEVVSTISRSDVWRALTPQMFRLGELTMAIERAIRDRIPVTDESGAIELTARLPRIIAGSPDNIKITRPEDLALAELYLRRQAQEESG